MQKLRLAFLLLAVALGINAACVDTPQTASTTKAVAGTTKIFIFSGQSNAGGHGQYLQTYPVPTWAQNAANGWDGSPLASSESGVQYPRPTLTGLPYKYNANNWGGANVDAWGTHFGQRPVAGGGQQGEEFFGPELSFAYKYRADHPTEDVVFLKQTVGGSSLEEWLPGTAYHNLLIQQITQAKARLTAAGKTYEFAGFFWIQGENGAASVWPYLNPTPGQEYSDKARTLFASVRNATSSTLPIVVARIGNHLLLDNIIGTYSSGIDTPANRRGATNYRRAQQVLLGGDPGNTWVSSDDLPVLQTGNSAYWYHHTGRGHMAYGERMYAAWTVLTAPAPADAGIEASPPDAGADVAADLGPEAPPPLVRIGKLDGVVQTGWHSVVVKLNGTLVTLPGGPGDTLEFDVLTQ